MSLKIKEINVKNLGPLKQFNFQPAQFNLIFGRNEQGKTYLVEFLIRALFRNARLWPLRSQKGRGKVLVQGLSDDGVFEFTPSSTKKLEDFWAESEVGLPADFSKLLVVKGAELEIANVAGGADKTILKRYLSSREILDKIEANISKTILESQFVNNVITGPRRGEISTRSELADQLKKLNQLFNQIDKSFSGGNRKTLETKRERIQVEIQKQTQAKNYLAQSVHSEIKQLTETKNRIAAEKIQEIKTGLKMYKQKVAEYKQKKEEQQTAEAKSQHYEWLKSAHEIYANVLKEDIKKPNMFFLILAVLLIAGAGALAFLNLPLYAIAALVGVILFGFLYVRSYRNWAEQRLENQEIANIKREFQQRFQQELTGLPMILEYELKMEKDFNNSRLLKEQLSEELQNLYKAKVIISEQLFEITGEHAEPQTWNTVLAEMEDKLQKIESQLRERELYLASLGVDPSDYEVQKPDITYSKQKLDELESKLRLTEKQLEDENQKLVNLKQSICHETGDSISTSWEDLLNNLQQKRQNILASYKQKSAEIIGKIAVREVIEELRKTEDAKILAGLKSTEVQEPLMQVTKRYNSLELDGENLVVSDAYDHFPLSELSTGAQEQILLALRIGFSTKLMKQDSLFLILDDAFQYSDWNRRKLLIDKVAALARSGWQILYFSMDDHIRELFDKKGKTFGDDYKFVELAAK
ncbi:MAG: ATP-binding protein [bacterium]